MKNWHFVAFLGALLLGSLLYYLFCINHVDANEIGLAYDSRSGHVYAQPTGYHITSPFVRVTYIDTRPFVVSLTFTSEMHTLNVRLVQFDPEHVKEFVAIEGFHYISNGMNYTFAPYAFSGKPYPFLKILQ